MYYRRKILLSLLEVFDNELEKIRLKKLLLLFTQKQENPDYDFVPYKFGCFSFHANADLHTMINFGHVKQENEKKRGKIGDTSQSVIKLIERYNYYEWQNSI